jgi:hypothetical protein
MKNSVSRNVLCRMPLCRMQPANHNVRCMSKMKCKHHCARSVLAFQHQLKRRRVAAYAEGRQAEQPLYVSNSSARWRLNNNHAAAIASRASNHHFDGMGRKNGKCSVTVGGGGGLLHWAFRGGGGGGMSSVPVEGAFRQEQKT